MADSPGGKEVGRISIRALPDTSNFRRRLKSQLEDIERRETVEVAVLPNVKQFRERVKAATAGIKTDVKVDVDVDRRSLSRLRERVGNSLDRIKMPEVGGGATAGIVGAAALFPYIAPALGLLTTALLAMPGLLAAVAAPAGALALGLEGLKNAAKRLEQPFIDLKAAMSAATERQFSPVFDQLGKIIPSLKGSLPSVTQGMADIAKSFADTVTSESGMAKIQGTISNISTALSKAAPGIGSFTDGLLTLAEKFTSKLPNVAEWFNGAGKSFSDWITKISSNGQLDTAFAGLGDSLRVILEAVGRMGEKSMDFFKDPKKIEDLAGQLERLGDSMVTIVDLSNKASDAMANAFSGATLPSFDFSSIVQDLTAPFTSADAPWRGMWDSIKSGASEAAAFVRTTWAGVTSWLSGIWGGITSAAASAWEGVKTAVSTAWETIKTAVSTGIDTVVSYVSGLPGKLTAAIGDLSGTLKAAGTALMGGLLSGIKEGLSSVLAFASGIAAKIAAVKGPLPYDRKVLIANGQALMQGLGTGLDNGFQSVLDRAKSMAEQISQAMANGTDLSQMLGGVKLPDLRKMLDTIEQEKKTLRVQLDNTTDKGQQKTLRDQIAQLQVQKRALDLQKDQLKLDRQYGSSDTHTFADAMYQDIQKLADEMVKFGRATLDQGLSDLGIGGGAITGLGTALMDYGIDVGKKYVFNVSNMDEALAGKQRIDNREALQWKR